MTSMSPVLRSLIIFGLLILVSGCSPQSPVPKATAWPSALPGSEQPEEGTSTPSSDAGGAVLITVWLPPTFDTAGGNLSANMLLSRLAEFTDRHPQVRIETRVKAEGGTGGLLDSLLSSQGAAPFSHPYPGFLP